MGWKIGEGSTADVFLHLVFYFCIFVFLGTLAISGFLAVAGVEDMGVIEALILAVILSGAYMVYALVIWNFPQGGLGKKDG